MKITIDFETRSECDIKRAGAWEYSRHPTTEVLCMAWCDDLNPSDVESFFLGNDDYDPEKIRLRTFLNVLSSAPDIEAHNAGFEFAIWHNIMVPRYGWPEVPDDRWYCSAAKAAAHGLPRSLDGATAALGLSQSKDKSGHRLMLKLCKPRPHWKKHGTGDKYFGTPEEFEQLRRYCEQDVRAEVALSEALDDLGPKERVIWRLDQRINRRGVYCDLALVNKAIELAETEAKRGKAAITELTDGEVKSPNQVAKLREWCNDLIKYGEQYLTKQDPSHDTCWHYLPDLSAATVQSSLAAVDNLPNEVRKALELRQAHSKSSVKKYLAMRDRAGDDGRIRETLLYHGAHTGRWTGLAIQPQNYPRPTLSREIIEGYLIPDILVGDVTGLEFIAGSVGEALANTLRSALCAAPGHDLIGADYSSIEARVLLWLAGDKRGLQLFAEGADIYKDMAATIYGEPVDQVTKEQRQLGKVAILGLGYQMGDLRFFETCRDWGVKLDPLKKLSGPITMKELAERLVGYPSEKMVNSKLVSLRAWFRRQPSDYLAEGALAEGALAEGAFETFVRQDIAEQILEAKRVVDTYRAKYKNVVQLWYQVQDAAMTSVFEGVQKAARCRFEHKPPWLRVHLPSGRALHYYEPKIKENKWGQPSLTHMGVNSITKKWGRQSTYGGKLVENIVQATARDIMAEAMIRCEQAKYPLVMSVHDELVAEVPKGFGSVAEFVDLLAKRPLWAAGCPIAAEGWRGERYRK